MIHLYKMHTNVYIPWQIAAADITGPMVKSKHGYEYVLIILDLFTRWVECIPLRKANAQSILKELKDKVVLRFEPCALPGSLGGVGQARPQVLGLRGHRQVRAKHLPIKGPRRRNRRDGPRKPHEALRGRRTS